MQYTTCHSCTRNHAPTSTTHTHAFTYHATSRTQLCTQLDLHVNKGKCRGFHERKGSRHSPQGPTRTVQATIKSKLPDIKNALESINFLIKKKGESFETNFELTDGMFAQATVTNPAHVCLWLGANVMVEYSFDEAHALLSKNWEGAVSQVKVLSEDLNFLKDQITTTEARRVNKPEGEGKEDEKESSKVETSSGSHRS